jgi:hypothetical protein
MCKKLWVPLLALVLILSLSFAALADTIRLKDGSVIRGQVVGFKDQQFTVLIGGGARGRRSTLTLYMEDVEAIEFDSATGAVTTSAGGDADNGMSGGMTQPTAQPRPTPSRPAPQTSTGTQGSSTTTQESSTGTQGSSTRTNTTGGSIQPRISRPTTTTRPSQPTFFQVNARVRADGASNGWTNTGLVVRNGQRLRITAMGQVSLGNGRSSQPAGITSLSDRDKLMADEPTGGLIAVIGDDNNDFVFIGRTRDFVAQRDGVLFLGVNESNLNDNTGAYDAVIEAEATGGNR